MPDNAVTRPTHVRYSVVFSLVLMSLLLYLDRFCVGMAEPYIKQDLNLSTFQIGIFFSAFFFTYALCQVPSGWFSDRYGARIMLTIYILAWSLFTALMGLSRGFLMLLLMRAAYGVGQAGAYPTSANVLSKWVPFSSRGMASSLVSLGGRLGGAIAPALTAFLIVLFVPAETSSLLQPSSLRNAVALCIKLSPVEVQPLSALYAHIRSNLPERTQQQIDEVAREFRPLAQEKAEIESRIKQLQKQFNFLAALKLSKEAEQIKYDVTSQTRQLLIESLNQIIQNDGFYSELAFSELKNLDRFGLNLMRRINAGDELTSQERERFHRLLLEASFPNGIGKVYVLGWRPVMIVYGLCGIFIAILYGFVVRNRPEDHPRCNSAELELINSNQHAAATRSHGKVGAVPIKRLLTSRSMWLSCFAQVGTNIGWVFLVTWFPRYLMEQHHVPILERGMMASVPLFAGWFGMIAGGRATDYLVSQVGLRWGRRLPWACSRYVAMTAFLLCPVLDSPWAVTITLSFVAIATDFGIPSNWSFCQDVGGKYVGSVLGWGNMWGNLGATISPILLAWIFESWGWTQMFIVCAIAFFAAGCCAMGIDATIPIVPDEDE